MSEWAVISAILMCLIPLWDAIRPDIPAVWRASMFELSLIKFQGEFFFDTAFYWWDWPRHRRTYVWGRGEWSLRV